MNTPPYPIMQVTLLGVFFFANARVPKYYLRIKLLLTNMGIDPLPSTKELKKEAKLAKAFMVLLKKKLARQQMCRSPVWRELMALALGKDGWGLQWG